MSPGSKSWQRSARKASLRRVRHEAPFVFASGALLLMPVNAAACRSAYHQRMNRPIPQLTASERKDLKVLVLFTATYCRAHHAGVRAPMPTREETLGRRYLDRYPVCAQCAEFLDYAFDRRLRCPLEEKPACKRCPVHCYRPGHRETVRTIMRYSGRHLLLRGRVDLLWRYFC